jgi:hypothetical protein
MLAPERTLIPPAIQTQLLIDFIFDPVELSDSFNLGSTAPRIGIA